MKQKAQVPRWMHRAFLLGALFFLVLCLQSIWVRDWWVALDTGGMALFAFGLWMGTEPKEVRR